MPIKNRTEIKLENHTNEALKEAKKNIKIAQSIIYNVSNSHPEIAIYLVKANRNLNLEVKKELLDLSKEKTATNNLSNKNLVHNEITSLKKIITPKNSHLKKIIAFSLLITFSSLAFTLFKNNKTKDSFSNLKLNSVIKNLKPTKPELHALFSKWKADYYCNKKLEGKPCLSKIQENINKDWGGKTPFKELEPGNFSVKFQTCINMKEKQKLYFSIGADDGYRVIIDEKLIKESWKIQGFKEEFFSINLNKGKHKLRLEYFQAGAASRVEIKTKSDNKEFHKVKTSYDFNC